MSEQVRLSVNKKDNNKTIEVEEVSNGFIVSVSKDYKAEDGEWKYETKKYISKTNPLTKNKEMESEDTDVTELGGTLSKLFNNLSL